MTKISNKTAYIPDTEINNEDYFIGTDADNSLATVNFKIGEVGSHYNITNGVRNFDYVFYQHQGVPPTPTDGYFYSNGNTQVLEDITYLIFPKKTSRGKDSSQFFDSMAIGNPFDLTIAQKIDNNTVFFFTINSIETFANYYKLNVAKVFFPIGKALEYVLSYAIFSLKTEGVIVHNNLSELINDGSDGTSTYVENDELSTVATSGNYSDLAGIPTEFNPSSHTHPTVPLLIEVSTFTLLPQPGISGIIYVTSDNDEQFRWKSGVYVLLSPKDKNYVHDQGIPSQLWVISHNLNKFPSVCVVDSAKSMVVGQIDYIDLNNMEISFNSSFSGEAYLN